ncbi:hydrogenase maturation nickel metallochaperone HypA [Fontivita pretiosa]|uniref:hydrogenase maturation nickel metallochaperone HypA/HybF n=1 Tax=Fontivita pretiosa TaxID=2989684 RepID=UPI003D175612
MHELSIASSILELARRHVPGGGVLTAVHVVAGPMRGIDPDAMQLAWRATVAGTDAERCCLHLELTPWTLRCPACGLRFSASDLWTPCACGCDRPYPVDCDELRLVSIEVQEPQEIARGTRPIPSGK